ncbi:KpsF/GutQ family sugar-phosphate isomerase [Sedimentitalea sp. CY04]|uniref:KpsF/GutQ family sugar-phosphate isomerase n=1 Tax=Parasedimentitalea denitrificans TaxID=2211118 RepID=A0ABX0W6Z4_9RHOB|nr:KpsF/GutQ family sugar-phosphate isomerase [Sedimentitalea sp. CY04]NIZ60559.1 KpsF/GutQ family sugar-phosphate isomerase [Sedimentitalea sp. CY04]
MTDAEKFLATARQVALDEARALEALAESFDERFAEAAQMILSATGRIIISGIGKSGHIGHKIAATLASTGTPAHFVHPAEASHGDLGMLSKGDVVLAISNSGEAPELANLVAFTRRFDIPLIGLSSKPESTLMTQADVQLQIPAMGEACGYGIVPSNSTTLTLAMGDALAIAIMKHRDFRPENFRDFHPGGKLGAQLSKVRDLMHSGAELPMVSTNTPMSDTLLEISQKGFGVTGVTNSDGTLVGIITDGDLRRHMDGLLDLTAEQVMTPNPTTIGPESLAEEAVSIMHSNKPKITCLLVVDSDKGQKAEGLLHIHDCLRAGLG